MSSHVEVTERVGRAHLQMGQFNSHSLSLSLSLSPLLYRLTHIVLLSVQAQASGLGNSVCTLYELHSGEDTSEEGIAVLHNKYCALISMDVIVPLVKELLNEVC